MINFILKNDSRKKALDRLFNACLENIDLTTNPVFKTTDPVKYYPKNIINNKKQNDKSKRI